MHNHKIRTTLVAAVASLGALMGSGLPAAAVTTQTILEDSDVGKVVQAAKSAMAKRQVKGCIAIANAEGIIIYFERQQGAYTNCNGSALVKAKAAAEFQTDTTTHMELLDHKGQTHLLKVPDMSPLPGGSPLLVDDKVVGGIGISTPDGDIDIPVAKEAAASIASK
jgi:glc operon protein GlcG